MILQHGFTTLLVFTCFASEPDSLLKWDFESVEIGSIPDGFLVLEGDFSVQEDGENHVLKLSELPLATMAVLFGEENGQGVSIKAKIKSETQKRRIPSFGVGLNGLGGYKLQLTPAKKSLELYRADELVKSVPYPDWESGSWICLMLQVRPMQESKWIIEGKAWPDGSDEPNEFTIAYEESGKPLSGKASLWGTPYSGKPILYDDVEITSIN